MYRYAISRILAEPGLNRGPRDILEDELVNEEADEGGEGDSDDEGSMLDNF
jgi:hypothetical protein